MSSKQRRDFLSIYEYIKDNLYYCNDDIVIGNNEYNSSLILGMLTAVTNSSLIYVGEYGLGKTSLAETISSLIFSLPKDVIESSSVKGNPDLGYEQLVGRPDLGELNQGKEKIIWSNFIFSKSKVVDEINRIPEHKQNILLTGMENNSWKYLNSYIVTEESPWFATKNYKDSGNNGIIPPLLDRFALCVESKSPGVNNSRLIRLNEKESISYPDIALAYEAILQTKDLKYDEFKQGAVLIREEFRKRILKDKKIHLLDDNDLQEIKKQISKISFDNDSNYLMDVVNAELGSCQLYGQKRSHEECPQDCHFTNYACYKTNNNISVRTILAINDFSKALGWLDDKSTVNEGFVENILPYALWHKTDINQGELEKNKYQARMEPLKLEVVKNIVKEISKRAKQIRKHQEEFASFVLNDDLRSAESLAKGQDHPVFNEYLK